MINKGKTVIITGGNRGIGASIAEAFAVHQSHIVIWDVSGDNFENLKEIIESSGSTAEFMKVDVSDFNDVNANMQKVIEKHAAVDVLVNNAGITRDKLLMVMEEDEWDSVININLKGTFNCCKAVIRSMIKKRSGSIINIASVIGKMGNKGQANYAASKAGIMGLTKSLAKEVGQRNVRVNAIAPGFIETAMTQKLSEDVIDAYSELIPMKRMGKPADVANLCLFLASDYSSYITGQVINCDGGMLM